MCAFSLFLSNRECGLSEPAVVIYTLCTRLTKSLLFVLSRWLPFGVVAIRGALMFSRRPPRSLRWKVRLRCLLPLPVAPEPAREHRNSTPSSGPVVASFKLPRLIDVNVVWPMLLYAMQIFFFLLHNFRETYRLA